MIYFNISVLDKLSVCGACSLSNSNFKWRLSKLNWRTRSIGVARDNNYRSRSMCKFSDNVRTSYSIINHELR